MIPTKGASELTPIESNILGALKNSQESSKNRRAVDILIKVFSRNSFDRGIADPSILPKLMWVNRKLFNSIKTDPHLSALTLRFHFLQRALKLAESIPPTVITGQVDQEISLHTLKARLGAPEEIKQLDRDGEFFDEYIASLITRLQKDIAWDRAVALETLELIIRSFDGGVKDSDQVVKLIPVVARISLAKALETFSKLEKHIVADQFEPWVEVAKVIQVNEFQGLFHFIEGNIEERGLICRITAILIDTVRTIAQESKEEALALTTVGNNPYTEASLLLTIANQVVDQDPLEAIPLFVRSLQVANALQNVSSAREPYETKPPPLPDDRETFIENVVSSAIRTLQPQAALDFANQIEDELTKFEVLEKIATKYLQEDPAIASNALEDIQAFITFSLFLPDYMKMPLISMFQALKMWHQDRPAAEAALQSFLDLVRLIEEPRCRYSLYMKLANTLLPLDRQLALQYSNKCWKDVQYSFFAFERASLLLDIAKLQYEIEPNRGIETFYLALNDGGSENVSSRGSNDFFQAMGDFFESNVKPENLHALSALIENLVAAIVENVEEPSELLMGSFYSQKTIQAGLLLRYSGFQARFDQKAARATLKEASSTMTSMLIQQANARYGGGGHHDAEVAEDIVLAQIKFSIDDALESINQMPLQFCKDRALRGILSKVAKYSSLLATTLMNLLPKQLSRECQSLNFQSVRDVLNQFENIETRVNVAESLTPELKIGALLSFANLEEAQLSKLYQSIDIPEQPQE